MFPIPLLIAWKNCSLLPLCKVNTYVSELSGMHQCVYAWAPKWGQRPGWACTESCAQQLPVAASDRHSTALISWPVTADTHSCAALREQAEHRPRLRGAEKTQTLMNTFKTSVITFRTKDSTSYFCLRGHAAALHTSLWLHWTGPFSSSLGNLVTFSSVAWLL